jgi:hypothetical protein
MKQQLSDNSRTANRRDKQTLIHSSPPRHTRMSLRRGQTTLALPSGPSPSQFTTDSPSVCMSWCRAPSGAHDQIVINCLTVAVLSCRGPSLTGGRVCLLSVIVQRLGQHVHELFTVFMSHMLDIYTIYTSPCQSRLGTADHALQVVPKATTALLDT